MTYPTILRTVQVGLAPNGDFNIEIDVFDIAPMESQIVASLAANVSAADAQAIYDSYKRYYVRYPSSGSVFDVIAEGPVVFLYVVDSATMANWRFDETEGLMTRKRRNGNQPDNKFKNNFKSPFILQQDGKGVLMYGIFDINKDHGTSDKFGFDIFMKTVQADGEGNERITQITIDPETDNDGGDFRQP